MSAQELKQGDVVYRIPKWYFVALAVPTLAALVLGGLWLSARRQMSLIPLGSRIEVADAVFGSSGCFALCENDSDCDDGFTCETYDWQSSRCTADICKQGLGCGSVCDSYANPSQCASGLSCTTDSRCWGDACGSRPAACSQSCETDNGYPDQSMCPAGYQCVGYVAGVYKLNPYYDYYCHSDACYPGVGGHCGDACGPNAPCGAELFCKPGENGSDSTCWHPACPVAEGQADNPPAQDVNPNNVPPLATELPTETVCTCEGTTLICTDGTVAEFNPACGVGGDACGSSTCGDGTCSAACGEDINTCPVDCHL